MALISLLKVFDEVFSLWVVIIILLLVVHITV